MQGTISAINRERHSGHIKGDDGELLYFDSGAFLSTEDGNDIAVGMRVSYEAEGDRAYEMELLNKEEFQRDELFYFEPEKFELKKGPFKEGFEIIARGKLPLEVVDRDIERGRGRLIMRLKETGANIGLNMTVEEEPRNVMGYGFIFYHIRAYPAVCARRSDDGNVSLGELKNALNHKKIHAEGYRKGREFVKKLALRTFIVLFVLSCGIGFLLS